MSIIAYDGRTLAADKQSTCNGARITTTKVRRVFQGMAGACGDSAAARALMVWADGGCKVADFPEQDEDDGNNAQMLLVTFEGKVLLYSGGPYPTEVEDRFTAMGSGRDYALAAMHLGMDARSAVQVACDLDVYCGCGITTVELP